MIVVKLKLRLKAILFHEELSQEVRQRIDIENELTKAIEK